jgi:hypothetical protein
VVVMLTLVEGACSSIYRCAPDRGSVLKSTEGEG